MSEQKKKTLNIADIMRGIKERNPEDEYVGMVSDVLDIRQEMDSPSEAPIEIVEQEEEFVAKKGPEEKVVVQEVPADLPVEPEIPTYEEVLERLKISKELADEIIDSMLFEGEYEHTFTYRIASRNKEIKIILGAFGGDSNVKDTNEKMSLLIDQGIVTDDNYPFYLDKCNLAHSIRQIGPNDLREKSFEEKYEVLDKRPGHVVNSWNYLLGRYSEMVHAVMNHPDVIQNF